MRHGLLHHAGRLHHLRQEHLARAEQVADHVHAVHQRTFDDVQRTATLGQDALIGLLGVVDDELGDAVHQRVAEAVADRHRRLGRAAPVVALALVLGAALRGLGHFDQALSGIGPAVEHHVFHPFAQHRLQVVVHPDHAGVDDAHVHAGLDRVVQEHGVDRFAHRVVAAKAEAHVAHAARHLGAGQVLLDPARRLDEVDRVVVVLLDAGGHREDVRVEDDVLGRESDFVDEDAVGAPADLDLALVGVGLSLLVEGHHHGRRAVAAQQLRLVAELVFAFLHADRVDDALALDAAQPGFDHLPFRAVDHDRHARYVGLRRDQVQEADHRGLAVEHGLVHVDVDDLRAVLDLLARHGQGFLELAVEDHPREGLGTSDVGAFADVDEQRALADAHGLEARQLHRGNGRDGRGRRFGHGLTWIRDGQVSVVAGSDPSLAGVPLQRSSGSSILVAFG